ncbi:hypothetical protein RRG08_045434 [Elysia crispata]|uniref:Uncharacterized protein n=1 Tax=Elysia crispata TaxID=231223 RepID=A0AAE1AWR9_9GAST|nr:hypothetical protein RRG08_045434 [Elysia crispata]
MHLMPYYTSAQNKLKEKFQSQLFGGSSSSALVDFIEVLFLLPDQRDKEVSVQASLLGDPSSQDITALILANSSASFFFSSLLIKVHRCLIWCRRWVSRPPHLSFHSDIEDNYVVEKEYK